MREQTVASSKVAVEPDTLNLLTGWSVRLRYNHQSPPATEAVARISVKTEKARPNSHPEVPRRPETDANPSAASAQVTTVYVTRTGSKYHRFECRHLSIGRIPVVLAEAQEKYNRAAIVDRRLTSRTHPSQQHARRKPNPRTNRQQPRTQKPSERRRHGPRGQTVSRGKRGPWTGSRTRNRRVRKSISRYPGRFRSQQRIADDDESARSGCADATFGFGSCVQWQQRRGVGRAKNSSTIDALCADATSRRKSSGRPSVARPASGRKRNHDCDESPEKRGTSPGHQSPSMLETRASATPKQSRIRSVDI